MKHIEFKPPVELLSNRLRFRTRVRIKSIWNGRILFNNPVSMDPIIEELTSGSGIGIQAESWFEVLSEL